MDGWNEASRLLKSIEDINKGWFWDAVNRIRRLFSSDEPTKQDSEGSTSVKTVKDSEGKKNVVPDTIKQWEKQKEIKQNWDKLKEEHKPPITVPTPKPGDAVA